MLGEVLRQCAPNGRVEGDCGGRECIRLWRSEDGDRRWSRGRSGRRILFVDGGLLAGSCGRLLLLLWLGCCGCVCVGGGAGVDGRLGEFVNYLRRSALWSSLASERAVSPHRGVPGYTAVSPATRHCQRGLAMLVAATAGGTHESSEPSSTAFSSTVCAASSQPHKSSPRCAKGSQGRARHLPEVIVPARGGGLWWWWAQGALMTLMAALATSEVAPLRNAR